MLLSADELNRLLDQRVRDVAARRPADSLQGHLQRSRDDRQKLLRCLGLDPLPPQTDLAASVTGIVEREGYRIEKISYRSRPQFTVTAHLYLPADSGPSPLVLRPHGHWPGKKSEPLVQASAISLVLADYAVFVIESPGESGEPPELNERRGAGPHDDPFLALGMPVEGFYVWDIMRGLDYLQTRSEIAMERIGITGSSGGGMASAYAFAVDDRIRCAAPVCYAASMELAPHNGCLCNHVPGIMEIGDRSDLLGIRAPAPVVIVGALDDPEFPPAAVQRTGEKS